MPDRFTERGEPPVVTLTDPGRPGGGVEVSGGRVLLRFRPMPARSRRSCAIRRIRRATNRSSPCPSDPTANPWSRSRPARPEFAFWTADPVPAWRRPQSIHPERPSRAVRSRGRPCPVAGRRGCGSVPILRDRLFSNRRPRHDLRHRHTSRRPRRRSRATRRTSAPSPMPSGPISSGSCRPTARSPSPSAAATFGRARPAGPGGASRIPLTGGRTMELVTAELREKLLANGRFRDCDHVPVVRWFNPGRRGNLARERARSRTPGHRPLPRRSRHGLPRDRQRKGFRA